MHHKTPPTLRFQLIRLVAVSMLPVWLVSGVLLYYAYSSKCGQVTESMQDTARYQAVLVDQELAKVQASLLAFATSTAFDERDFRHLHQRALKMLELFPGADLIVADETGQQLLNSFRPFGSPLPKRNNPETVRTIFATGKPVISDLFYGALTRRPLIGIDVPVTRDGKVLYDLAMTFPSDRIAAILRKQKLPAGSYSSILDSQQIIVASFPSSSSQWPVGSGVHPGLRQRLLHALDGSLEIDYNLGSKPVFVVFSRSAISGWSVVVGTPKATVMTEIYRWIGWTISGIAVISIFGILLSILYARRITHAISSLIAPALSIGRGEPAVICDTYSIKETGEVAAALVQASELIQSSNKKLRESECRYSALFANKINAMAHCRVITDEFGKPVDYWILQVNDAYEQIIGIKKEDIEGRTVREVFPGVERFEFDYIGVLGRIALEGGEIKTETFLESTCQFLSIYAYCPAPGEFTAIISDITERKRAEEMLSMSKILLEQLVQERTESLSQAVAQLRHENDARKKIEQDLLENQRKLESMSIDLSLAEERERDRIAGELHDQVGQRLIFGKMILDALAGQVSGNACESNVQELSRVMDLSIQDIRSLTFQLRPPLLASAGLEAALHWLGEEFREKYGLLLTFSDDGQQHAMRYETRSCVFQAVREILLNTAKHANATHIGIDIMHDDQLVKLRISDNGRGFEPSEARMRKSKSGGFGLINVQQRIEHLGGRFLIESSPGNGTCVTISVPMDSGRGEQP